MCTFDGSLAMEPFPLCSSRRFYPIVPPTTLVLICWMLRTNQKEKTLYPKLKVPQQLHFVSIKNEPGSFLNQAESQTT
jgi:hypothetical protein